MILARLIVISIVHLAIYHYEGVVCTTRECNDGQYAADPFDCNGFLQCEFGRWIQRNCAAGLHFHQRIFACDYPWNANCVIDSTTTSTTTTPDDPTTTYPPTTISPTTGLPTTFPPTTAPPTTITPTTYPPTTFPPTTDDPPTFPPTTDPPTTIPPTTGPPTTDPPTSIPPTTGPPTTDTPFPSTPPPITTTTQAPTTPPTTGTPTQPITTTVVPTTVTPFPTATTPIAPTDPTPPPNLSCPPYDGPYVVHLPHPNCTMFYKCVHGIPHEMICPFAQHWAIPLDRCESPLEANCVDGAARNQTNARPPNYW